MDITSLKQTAVSIEEKETINMLSNKEWESTNFLSTLTINMNNFKISK